MSLIQSGVNAKSRRPDYQAVQNWRQITTEEVWFGMQALKLKGGHCNFSSHSNFSSHWFSVKSDVISGGQPNPSFDHPQALSKGQAPRGCKRTVSRKSSQPHPGSPPTFPHHTAPLPSPLLTARWLAIVFLHQLPSFNSCAACLSLSLGSNECWRGKHWVFTRLETSLHPFCLLDVHIQLCGAEKRSQALLGFFLIPSPSVLSFCFWSWHRHLYNTDYISVGF